MVGGDIHQFSLGKTTGVRSSGGGVGQQGAYGGKSFAVSSGAVHSTPI